MQHNIVLSYNNLYPQQAKPGIEDLLQGLDKNYILNLINFLNDHQPFLNTTKATIGFLAERWLSQNSKETFSLALEKINEATVRFPDSEITIFNPQSTLIFVEKLLDYLLNNKNAVEKSVSNTEAEINLLKIYLIINQDSDLTDNGIEQIEANHPNESRYWLILLRPFQYADLINRDTDKVLFAELGKAILFFKLLLREEKTKQLLQAFLKKYEATSWQEYLTAVTSLSAMTLKTNKLSRVNNLIEIDNQFPLYNTCIRIIDYISVPITTVEFAPDFMLIRNHPIIRTAENRFQIVYVRFLIEKIFKALYFDFREINKELKVMSDGNFRRFYTSEYSENQLSYYVLNNIFSRCNVRIECNLIEKDNPQFGPTDYIAFSNRNIFLFESKDILIKKEIKQSMHLPDVRDTLRAKFYKDGNSDKALVQLAKNITKIMKGDYSKYGLHIQKYMFFYPVIVVHSDSFNVFGINQIIKQWFREACQEVGITKKELYKIKNPIIVDINTLMLYQEYINKGKIQFERIIDNYNFETDTRQLKKKKVKSSVSFQEQYCMPFSYFLENYIGTRKKIGYPKTVISELTQTFDNARVSGNPRPH